MRIAWVSPYLPEPATSGGVIRQQRLAAALATHAEVHLFARGDLWEKPRLSSRELSMFETRWLGRDYLPRAFRATESRRVRRGSPASLYRAVAELHARTPLDLVVVSHSWAALGAPSLGLPWLLDEHNIESRYFADVDRARQRSGARTDREIVEIERWERQAWASATLVSCVSNADREAIAGASSAEPVVVPNGADVASLVDGAPEQRMGGVLFVGSMHHAPNVDAALRLTETIMPRVWREIPGLSLTIVGGPVPARLLAAREKLGSSATHVNITGIVPAVGPYLSDARVYANPLRHGAGSSLKIVEALAAGAPIVSTEIGARGFDLAPGVHFLAAESDEDQARAVVRVARDAELAASLSRAGRQQAERYGWDAIGATFVDLVRRAALAGPLAARVQKSST
jgi:glycosyltransferase involved in cell wall biosynthesis